MSARGLARAWNEFFFQPAPPTPVALFRIAYGLLVIAELALLRPDWLTWFGTRGMTTLKTMQQMEPGTRIDLFALMPASDAWVEALFWVFLCFAAMLAAGLLTRLSSIAVFLCLCSIHERALYILNAGDTLLRVTGFFLMFAPAGAALSADRLLRIWRGKEGAEIPPKPPWAQRMIQVQVSLAYLVTFYYKTMGAAWLDGTALGYVYRLEEFRRFPAPAFLRDALMVRLGTWGTLAVEFALGALVWLREWRYPILLAGAALHLSLEYIMNVPLFQWIIVSTYLTFLYPEDLTRVWNRARARVNARLGEPVLAIYDGGSEGVARAANVLRAIDIFGRLRMVDLRAKAAKQAVPVQEGRNRIWFQTPYGPRAGLAGLRFAAKGVPLLWPLALGAWFGGPVKERTGAVRR
jgi:hypothetical protein